jgi:hypothetical protein
LPAVQRGLHREISFVGFTGTHESSKRAIGGAASHSGKFPPGIEFRHRARPDERRASFRLKR